MSGRVGSITTGIISDGLVFNMDAANRACYPKTGTKTFNTIDTTNTGSLINDVAFNTNPSSFEFGLDGIDDYIDFGNILNFERTNPFSIECWFKRDRSGASEFLVAKQESTGNFRGYSVLLPSSDDFITVVLRSQNTTSARLIVDNSTAITDTNWHQTVITYDGSSNTSGILIYLDGIDDTGVKQNTLSATIITSTPLQIGARNGGDSFDGNIGPVHIYNRALSANEVLHNYNALKSRFGL